MSAFTPRRRGRNLAFSISIAVIAGLALVGVALLQQPSPHGSVGSPLTVIATPSAQPSASPSLTPSPSPQPTLSAAPRRHALRLRQRARALRPAHRLRYQQLARRLHQLLRLSRRPRRYRRRLQHRLRRRPLQSLLQHRRLPHPRVQRPHPRRRPRGSSSTGVRAATGRLPSIPAHTHLAAQHRPCSGPTPAPCHRSRMGSTRSRSTCPALPGRRLYRVST